jgi:hypothetical protein
MNLSKKAGSRQPRWAALPQPPEAIREYELLQPIPGWITIAARLRNERLVRLTWHREREDAAPLAGHPALAPFIAEITRRHACQRVGVFDLGEYGFSPGDIALLIERRF